MSSIPAIRVEFLGIPRQRTGVASAEFMGQTVGDVLRAAEQAFPKLGGECLRNGVPEAAYLVAVNGVTLTRDSQHPLTAGDWLLLLNADVGG